MNRWTNKIAVVTGASVGIGSAIVKELLSHNIKVVGLARRPEKVDEIRSKLSANHRNNLHAMKCDVSNEAEVKNIFATIEKKFGAVDILVNNAGIMNDGNLSTMPIEQIKSVIDTNIMGVIYCTREAFRIMQSKNIAGHIIFINSVLGHRIFDAPMSFNIYAPSKYAVTAMREIFKSEFKNLKTQIKTTSISPGLVRTAIVPEGFDQAPALNPEDIANAVGFALSTPPHVQISELTVEPLCGF